MNLFVAVFFCAALSPVIEPEPYKAKCQGLRFSDHVTLGYELRWRAGIPGEARWQLVESRTSRVWAQARAELEMERPEIRVLIPPRSLTPRALDREQFYAAAELESGEYAVVDHVMRRYRVDVAVRLTAPWNHGKEMEYVGPLWIGYLELKAYADQEWAISRARFRTMGDIYSAVLLLRAGDNLAASGNTRDAAFLYWRALSRYTSWMLDGASEFGVKVDDGCEFPGPLGMFSGGDDRSDFNEGRRLIGSQVDSFRTLMESKPWWPWKGFRFEDAGPPPQGDE